jgi:hypothetical protein
VQEFDYGQMRVSGCRQHYKSVLVAGTKAKTVTNNLPILSVLVGRLLGGLQDQSTLARIKRPVIESALKIRFVQVSVLTKWDLKFDNLIGDILVNN